MKPPLTPEQLEQLEKYNPAMEMVEKVNELFPGTFPTKSEMDLEHLELDVNAFDQEGEGDIPNN